VIKERVVFPFLIGCQVVKLRGKREQLLSFSHGWVVVTAVICLLSLSDKRKPPEGGVVI
tara:strand:- start:269 stop:445 length:177 start_codon:yes stop_codon:yes gene_type:complete